MPVARRQLRIAVVCFLTIGLAVVACQRAFAQTNTALRSLSMHPNGFVVQVPSNTAFSRRSGLRLEVDSRWMNSYGYRPVRVTLTAARPTKAEHVVTIRLHMGWWDWRSGSVTVEQDIVMPAGSTSADATLACPQYRMGNRYWWEVWVDGVKDKDISIDEVTGWQLSTANTGNVNVGALKFLIVGAATNASQMMGPGADLFEALVLAPADLPARWIDYSAIDVVSLSPTALQWIAGNRPEVLRAIRYWVQAGGQLWVSPVGAEWEDLVEVERLLELPRPATSETPAPAAADDEVSQNRKIAERGWRPIEFAQAAGERRRTTLLHLPTNQSRVVRDASILARLQNDPDWVIVDDAQTASESLVRARNDKLPADSTPWYVERPLGLGTLRVFRNQWDPVGFALAWQMLQGTAAPDASIPTPLTEAIDSTRGWESRHGMNPESANADFANLLVPGVGQAPVTEFRVLITLFVLLIGPVNYWLLKRTHRLHLLVLTVPIVAAVLTTGLFAYALMSDGLGTKVRVRSFTTLDQRTGEAACWARLSFYAGLAPGSGLTLPDDTTIYPIIPGWNEASNRAFLGASREMEWTAGVAQLTQGWLRSRTPTQYLTVRVRQSPHRLQLRSAQDALAATNQLGADVRYVAVVDGSGKLFAGEDLPVGATTTLEPAPRARVLQRLRRAAVENAPSIPPELEDESDSFAILQRRRQRQYLRGQYGLEYSTERLSENLLEGALAELTGSGGVPLKELPPRSFVAITKTGPEVVVGIPRAQEEASFHVVVGTW